MDNKLNLSFIFLKGVVQGIVTGIRGLCNGLGPALFGLIFYIFHVNLTDNNKLNQDTNTRPSLKPSLTNISSILERGDVLREQSVSLYLSWEFVVMN